MSASGYKQTFGEVCQRVRFTPKSGHSEAQERVGLKKRTLDVRLTPKSGRIWVTEFMPAYDPTRTSRLLAERVDSGNIFNLLGQRMKSGGLGVDYFGIIWA